MRFVSSRRGRRFHRGTPKLAEAYATAVPADEAARQVGGRVCRRRPIRFGDAGAAEDQVGQRPVGPTLQAAKALAQVRRRVKKLSSSVW